MHTLWDYLTFTKGVGYLLAFGILLGFIPFWLLLTEREKKGLPKVRDEE